MLEKVEVNSKRWFDLKPLKNEIWKDVIGYEKLYQISNYGRIKSNNKKIRMNVIRNNYYSIILFKNKKYKPFLIHRLIAIHFIPNINNYPIINHIDGNKLNNEINNLEWCTLSHNVKEAFRLGLNKNKPHNLDNRKKVAQYDRNMKLIKIWDSICQASEFTNIHRNTISKNCKNGKISKKGYFWQFIDNNQKFN